MVRKDISILLFKMKPYLMVITILLIFIMPDRVYCQVARGRLVTDRLKTVMQSKKHQEIVDLIVVAKDLQQLKKSNDIQIIQAYPGNNSARIRITVTKLTELLDSNKILFADVYRKPKEELTTGSNDQSLNAITFAHSSYPNVNGDSILVSINEQRFDTSDIDLKGRYIETGTGAETEFSHASIMATILAGGGNTSPYAKGAAWGANLASSDFASLLPDPDSIYRKFDISIQNHSYGTGIENYYGADAAAYDVSVWNNPFLLHVFSSGNSGTSADSVGFYRNIEGFANLTGSFKMAKNILTVGATDSMNQVAALSSKGPAYDGRVKPELVAFGEDGSSGAAAMVSGAAALVQQAYKYKWHHLPSAALVKTVLINGADDINNEHVDFISGYGSLNAYNSIATINESRWYEDSVKNGATKNISINVPAGVAKLKLTMAWTDTAAAPNAPKALVNDLDAVLQLPATGESWLPWVLNAAPDKNILMRPATRQRDTLNNTEQITLDHPQAGIYQLQITGSKVQTISAQGFAVAFQMDTLNQFYWTYPSHEDVLQSATSNTIRWQTNIQGTASIDYSTDGVQWKRINDNADLKSRYFKWSVPDTVSKALLRMNIPGQNAIISDTFVLSRKEQMQVGFNCNDSFLLYWNKQPVSQYRLYQLGAKYMEPIRDLADSFSVFQKEQSPSFHYAVAPVVNGKPGLRSFTINYTTQGVGCYVQTFYAQLLDNNKAELSLELGTLYQVATIVFQKWTGNDYITIATINAPASTQLSAIDQNLLRGENIYRVQIRLQSGSVINSENESLFYFPDQPVIIYPVPARQDQPVNIVVRDQGVYSIRIIDATGRLVKRYDLNDIASTIPPLSLSKGLYFVHVYSDKGTLFVQKIIVL